jgi:hypothetical protein
LVAVLHRRLRPRQRGSTFVERLAPLRRVLPKECYPFLFGRSEETFRPLPSKPFGFSDGRHSNYKPLCLCSLPECHHSVRRPFAGLKSPGSRLSFAYGGVTLCADAFQASSATQTISYFLPDQPPAPCAVTLVPPTWPASCPAAACGVTAVPSLSPAGCPAASCGVTCARSPGKPIARLRRGETDCSATPCATWRRCCRNPSESGKRRSPRPARRQRLTPPEIFSRAWDY